MSSFSRYFRLAFVILLAPGMVLSGSIIASKYVTAKRQKSQISQESIRKLAPGILHQLEEDMISFSLFSQSNSVRDLFRVNAQEVKNLLNKL